MKNIQSSCVNPLFDHKRHTLKVIKDTFCVRKKKEYEMQTSVDSKTQKVSSPQLMYSLYISQIKYFLSYGFFCVHKRQVSMCLLRDMVT